MPKGVANREYFVSSHGGIRHAPRVRGILGHWLFDQHVPVRRERCQRVCGMQFVRRADQHCCNVAQLQCSVETVEGLRGLVTCRDLLRATEILVNDRNQFRKLWLRLYRGDVGG